MDIPVITSGTLDVGDALIAYDIVGRAGEDKKPPMLLLHGNGESRHIFNEVIASHVNDSCFIRIDSRAQGLSTGTLTSYDQMAEDTKKLLLHLKIDSCSVIGFSDGAIIAMMLAIDGYEFDKMMLIGANICPEGMCEDAIIQLKAERETFYLLGDIANVQLFDMMLNQPNIDPSSLKHIHAREVFVVAGDNDMIKAEHTQMIADMIPNSKLVIVSNSSHMIPAEHPEAICELI